MQGIVIIVDNLKYQDFTSVGVFLFTCKECYQAHDTDKLSRELAQAIVLLGTFCNHDVLICHALKNVIC